MTVIPKSTLVIKLTKRQNASQLVSRLISQSISQANMSISSSINQSVSKSFHQYRTVSQSISPQVSHSIDQLVIQSVSLSHSQNFFALQSVLCSPSKYELIISKFNILFDTSFIRFYYILYCWTVYLTRGDTGWLRC